MEGRFVGLDVNVTAIQAAVRPTGERWETARHDQGIAEVSERLRSIDPTLVVIEAHGGSELAVAGALATLGLPFALVPSRNIREFARALGRFRADDGQAGLLAYFAELVRPEVRTLSSETIEQLRCLRGRRQQIQEILRLERSRLTQDSPILYKDIKSHVYFLERSLLTIGEEISRTVRSSCIWR